MSSSPQLWQRLPWNQLPTQVPFNHRRLLRTIRRNQEGLLSLLVLLVLLRLNWALVLTGTIGLSTAVLVYQAQQSRRWQRQTLALWRWLWRPSNRALTVACSSGAVAMLGSALAIALYGETQRPWLTLGLGLQGMATLAVLALLLWNGWGDRAAATGTAHSPAKTTKTIDDWFAQLAHTEPLQRLLAVRWLTNWALEQPPAAVDLLWASRQHLTDCFTLMLQHEPEPLVRQALETGRSRLTPAVQLTAGLQPPMPTLTVPLSLPETDRWEGQSEEQLEDRP